MDIVERLEQAAKNADMGRKADEKTLLRLAAREIKALRKALKPMTTGTFWITGVDVRRAKKALHMDEPTAHPEHDEQREKSVTDAAE